MKTKIGSRVVSSLLPRAKPYEVWDTEVPGFLIRVQPSGVMSFFCSYRRPDGRRTRTCLGRTTVMSVSQARDEARVILGKLVQGIDPQKEKQKARVQSLRVFLSQNYGPWVEGNRKTGKKTKNRLERCFVEFLDKQLNEITPWIVEKWRVKRKTDGIAPTTLNRDIGALKSALNRAKEWAMLESNPLVSVRPLKVDKSAIVRFLTPKEEKSLREALLSREEKIRTDRVSGNLWRAERNLPLLLDLNQVTYADYFRPLTLIAMLTGMRRGEVFNLRWENVSFSNRSLFVSGSNSKNGTTRHIPLNNEAFSTLSNWHLQQKSPTIGVVFPGRGGEVVLSDIKHPWETVLGIAKITNFRWHDLRHHFASRLVMAGVDLNTVRELLGHSDLKMTLRYAHLSHATKAQAVEKLDDRYLVSLEEEVTYAER